MVEIFIFDLHPGSSDWLCIGFIYHSTATTVLQAGIAVGVWVRVGGTQRLFTYGCPVQSAKMAGGLRN